MAQSRCCEGSRGMSFSVSRGAQASIMLKLGGCSLIACCSLLTCKGQFVDEFDVIVVGAGPAGCSAAITLTTLGARVLLLEEKRMPRPKLCGEFVTPECLPTLRRLGVLEAMIDAGAQRISKVRVVTASGRTVESKVPDISPTQEAAISLSRARFDQVLFERAAEIGVACMDGTAVKQRLSDGKRTIGVEAVSLPSGSAVRFRSAFVLDGSGRNSRLVVGQHERIGGLKGYRL